MPMDIVAQKPSFAAAVRGLDLSDGLKAADKDQLRSAAREFAVMIAKDQFDTDSDGLRAFAEAFVTPSDCDDITNVGKDGEI